MTRKFRKKEFSSTNGTYHSLVIILVENFTLVIGSYFQTIALVLGPPLHSHIFQTPCRSCTSPLPPPRHSYQIPLLMVANYSLDPGLFENLHHFAVSSENFDSNPIVCYFSPESFENLGALKKMTSSVAVDMITKRMKNSLSSVLAAFSHSLALLFLSNSRLFFFSYCSILVPVSLSSKANAVLWRDLQIADFADGCLDLLQSFIPLNFLRTLVLYDGESLPA